MSEEEADVVFRFSDDGPGIPDAMQGRLFDAFATHGKTSGTGLGLAIVNKIVEEHGGEMTFTSVETGGTRVTMRFARDPLAEESDAQTTTKNEG